MLKEMIEKANIALLVVMFLLLIALVTWLAVRIL